ncbi:MAG: hypothetical protein H0X40_06960 [Chthoniobacterales bacterium]|nr:hypothetical protein [Chthoniobacterales bacterium]
MKTRLTKSYLAGRAALLASLTLLAASSLAATAPSSLEARRGDRIEGVWDSQVTIVDCQSGTVLAGFRGLGMFIRGGSLTQTNNMPPALSSPSFGRWARTEAGYYTATFEFFRFLPDGTFSGVQKVTRDIQLEAGGDSFTSDVSFETYDTTGNLIATGCGTETATRVID